MSSPTLDLALGRLLHVGFQAQVFLGGKDSGVTLIFTPRDTMEIRGFQPGNDHRILVSNTGFSFYDGSRWQPMAQQPWMYITLLMDPRIYYQKTDSQSVARPPEGQGSSHYLRRVPITRVIRNLPQEYVDWLAAEGSFARYLDFNVSNAGDLIEFSQDNLPPNQRESVLVRLI